MNTLSLKRIQIRFQTADIIPPPYAHEYLIDCEEFEHELQLSFQLKYLEREELTLEEIYEEGYTENDDFDWTGSVNKIWGEELFKLIDRTKSDSEQAKSSENTLELVFTNTNNATETFSPNNPQEWEYFNQELIQAIYETANIELPLKLIYLKKLPQKPDIQLEMTILFSDRSIKTTMQVGANKESKELNWQTLHPLLKIIYSGEFLAEKATQQAPNKPGKYINVGDGLWYEFGKSLQNPNGNNRFLHEVEEKLDDLVG